MDPAAEVELSYNGERHLFEIYDDGRVAYKQSSGSSILDQVKQKILPKNYEFGEYPVHTEKWLEVWNDSVGAGAPHTNDLHGRVEVRVSPEYHDGENWRSASWDARSVSAQRKHNEEYPPLDAVREMIEELDHRPQALHQMTESSELETLVNTVLGVQKESTF